MSASTFTVTDPRSFDGDPYEVAERAIRQAAAVNAVLLECLRGAEVMARNAEMERNLYDSDDPKAADWDGTPQGKRLAALVLATEQGAKTLGLLERAVAFDPRKAR